MSMNVHECSPLRGVSLGHGTDLSTIVFLVSFEASNRIHGRFDS
jgi:hypothetical protein